MKVAIPVDNNQVSAHFGHCAFFAIYNIDDHQQIASQETIDAPPHQPGMLPGWLAERGVNLVITGGMGPRAQDLLAEHNVNVIVGVAPHAPDEVIAAYLQGTLQAGQNVCDH